MQLPIQITFRAFTPPEGTEARIRQEAANLDKYFPRIMGCRVMVEVAHRHHKLGNRYHVRIDLAVPEGEVVVAHEPSLHATLRDTDVEQQHKDAETERERRHLEAAVDEAFEVARRRLQDYGRRRRGAVKLHEPPLHGRVARLLAQEGYGFILTGDGREVYFNRNSVLDDEFDRLEVDSEVAFVEEAGEKGPQASTVRRLGKHHYG